MVFYKFCSMFFLLIYVLFTNFAIGKYICHNATGACDRSKYICANGYIIEHNQRCNMIEDCSDGSDEFLCDFIGHQSIFDSDVVALRLAILEVTCVDCVYYTNFITIHKSNKLWYDNAKLFPFDYYKRNNNNNNNNTEYTTVGVYKKKKKLKNNTVCCYRRIV